MITPDLSRTVWRKSSRSTENGGACVEVGLLPAGAAAVRDSKNPHSGALVLNGTTWNQFRAAIKDRGNDAAQ